MALKGNLRDFSVTQLLNLIHLARKTGALTLERDGTTAKLYFREGKLIYASLSGHDGSLMSILLRSGKITSEQSKAIQSRARANTEKELGLLLMDAGYVTQKDIVQGIKSHALEIAYLLFTWTDGAFRFDPNVLPPDDRITVTIDLENIIMEGSRRLKEWERLQEELPDLDMALRFTERPNARLRNIQLTVDEWRVISYINPRNTIRQIARLNSMDDFQIRKIVYGLLSAGLVELVKPEGYVPKPPPGERPPVRPPAVKRSLIMRLIDRIRRI